MELFSFGKSKQPADFVFQIEEADQRLARYLRK